MACEDLVAQCFMDEQAPLAVPELNRERTLKYLECCYRHGMSWDDPRSSRSKTSCSSEAFRTRASCGNWLSPSLFSNPGSIRQRRTQRKDCWTIQVISATEGTAGHRR